MTNLKNLGLNFQDIQTFYKVHLNPRIPLVLLNVECERNMLECIVFAFEYKFQTSDYLHIYQMKVSRQVIIHSSKPCYIRLFICSA